MAGGEEERSARGGADGRDETRLERADRNLEELLQELRVALPGVQVLFAFLLTIPFSQGFQRLTAFQEKIYFATLICSAVASALLFLVLWYAVPLQRLRSRGQTPG